MPTENRLIDLLEEVMCDFDYLKKNFADASLKGWLQMRIDKINQTLKQAKAQQEATNDTTR